MIRLCEYAVLIGPRLETFESQTTYLRGENPTTILFVVGASSLNDDIGFRLVTNQGTHLMFQATSQACRDTWVEALQLGLEVALMDPSDANGVYDRPKDTMKRLLSPRRKCASCGGTDTLRSSITPPSPTNGKQQPMCIVTASAAPVPHYGLEHRVDLCKDCETGQGLISHVEHIRAMTQSSRLEKDAISACRKACRLAMKKDSDAGEKDGSGSAKSLNDSLHVEISAESTKALVDVLQDSGTYGRWERQSQFLRSLGRSFLGGEIGVNDFLEQLDEAAGFESKDSSSLTALKKEAFRVAGDMGSALRLLVDLCLKPKESNNTHLICLLDFLLDLCREGNLSSVAFFWPQLCHLHLRLLPARDSDHLERVELLEDFLLTVACEHSIHLALQLVWSHTADLEESILSAVSADKLCKNRRFAVIRFICELESVLFGRESGWSGGSVALGRILRLSEHQGNRLKTLILDLNMMRREGRPQLSRSSRLKTIQVESAILPEDAAAEKLRVAKNADYYSSHLNFTRRLSDIAEKLRFMDVSARATALQQELNLLNVSGTMGGDPLNRIRESLIRVVRVPPNEGHVFRSKERTPVLLLMEVIDEDLAERDANSRLPSPRSDENETNVALSAQPHLASSDDEIKYGNAGALKKFAYDRSETPTTPKRAVEELVNNAAAQQLQVLGIPDLGLENETCSVQDEFDANSREDVESDTRPDPKQQEAKSPSSVSGYTSSGNLDTGDSSLTAAAASDVRRDVLNTLMMKGMEGDSIASGTVTSIQRSLQELERRRATELLMEDDKEATERHAGPTQDFQTQASPIADLDDIETKKSEEDEVMEAIRLMLIQARVAQGQLSPVDAAKVLQHASLNRVASGGDSSDDNAVDTSACKLSTVDAGDIDARLVGCGPIPPAVLQALTLWKNDLVTNTELLELVKKDVEFVKHSVLLDVENVDKLNEDSAFWGRFAFGERWAEKKARIATASPHGGTHGWGLTGVIVKSNDDLRQEAFVMQLIQLCQEAFDIAGLDLWVNPYRILATGRTTGIIEMVRNAMSFDALKKRPGYGKGGLREHLQRMTEFTADPGEAFKSAQLNFVHSLAAYSLMSYLFLFKDRHNGNILLDTAGHIIHIDFGFVFGIAPGGSFSLEMSTPFKLTEEMLDVMGGLRSPLFSEFVTLFCCGFLALQSYQETFLSIVEITCEESNFKCFEGKDTSEFLGKLRDRFCPEMSKKETVSHALELIRQATTSYGTRQYDVFQYLSQGIAA